jgi:hypothetical protein
MRAIKISFWVFFLSIIVVSATRIIPIRYMQFIYESIYNSEEYCLDEKCVEYPGMRVISVRGLNSLGFNVHLLGDEYSHRLSVYLESVDTSKLRHKGIKNIGHKQFEVYAYPEYLLDDRDRIYVDIQGGYAVNIDSVINWEYSVDEFLLSINVIDLGDKK